MFKKWKFRGGGGAYVKFPPWWGYGYFLELHIVGYVYRFVSKHSSDHYVLFCHDPFSHLAIDASSCMKLMHTKTD